MIIYSYKGDYKHQKEALFERAWKDYSHGKAVPTIIIGDKGKPYFKDAPYFFSISHSNQYWVCVFSPYQVGIDIQFIRFSGRELSTAKRFFSKAESFAVEKGEKKVFYAVWTRREALGKYLGTGFFIPEEINDYPLIKEFTLGDEYQGAIATEKEENIWIKTIK